MSTPTRSATKFTIRTANQTLPLVKMIVQDIVALSSEISETRERLDYLSTDRESGPNDEYAKELDSIKQSTDLKSDQVDRYVDELVELNVLPMGARWGYVDFPATREDADICLCWHLGDKEVMHWHRVDEKCENRRLVDLSLIRQSGDCHVSPSA